MKEERIQIAEWNEKEIRWEWATSDFELFTEQGDKIEKDTQIQAGTWLIKIIK